MIDIIRQIIYYVSDGKFGMNCPGPNGQCMCTVCDCDSPKLCAHKQCECCR